MTSKKVFGYIFVALSIVLFISIIGLLPKLFSTFWGIVKIFTGELDSYEVGKVIGQLIYWAFHFVITIALWIYGRRWIKINNQET